MRLLIGVGAFLGAALQLSCTFYTGCPTGNQPAPTGGTGTGNPSGGSGTGGSGMTPADGEPQGEEIVITSKWQDATGSLVGQATDCGEVMYLTPKPGTDKMIAGVVQAGLWETTDGAEWTTLGTGKDSATITNVPQGIVFDPADPQVFWEAGLYYGGGVYRTDDGGDTFRQLSDIGHTTTVSVDFTDPDRQTMLAAGHELPGFLWLSTNGGEDWEQIGPNIPDGTAYCDYVHVVDATHFLIGCATYGDGEHGILRSEDAGQTWERVTDAGGFREPLITTDGTMYWAALTVGTMVKSTDQGVTWDPVGAGPYRMRPLELPDGRLAAMGVSRLLISEDGGDVWSPVGPTYPEGSGLEFFAYSSEQRAFYASGGKCNQTVSAGAIQRLDFDYKKN